MLRSAQIFGDAVVQIDRDEEGERISGNMLIDEDYLRDRWGQKDFEKYRMCEGVEPKRMMPRKFPCLEVEEEKEEGVFRMRGKL